jgi:hypothetical protein
LAAQTPCWSEMEKAVEVVIDRQHTVVEWRDDHLRSKGGRGGFTDNGDAGLSVTEVGRMTDQPVGELSPRLGPVRGPNQGA